jgi:hypothetical protein
MPKYFVKYPNGAEEILSSSCETVEAYAMEHFGSSWGPAHAAGAEITLLEDPDALAAEKAAADALAAEKAAADALIAEKAAADHA